jgi:osmotically-inducible protein OsmY
MRVFALTLALAAIAGCADGTAPRMAERDATEPEVRTGTQTDADNTGVNERDRHEALKTPTDQYENQADIDTTAEIRRRVVDAENMSVNARNVKIITQAGKVTLRGPVKDMAERERIGQIAVDVAGKDNVDNMLEVESNP